LSSVTIAVALTAPGAAARPVGGLIVNTPCGAVPVPVIDKVCVPPPLLALSSTESVALADPVEVAKKLTLMVHDAPPANGMLGP
jgi:hypothetical protein